MEGIEGKENIKDKKDGRKLPFNFRFIIGLVIIVLFLLFLVFFRVEIPDYYPSPVGAFDMEYNITTDTYRSYVKSLSDETLEIEDFRFEIYNDKNTVKNDLEEILNNENSNITFYDKDNDGLYTTGDEFIIDGEIVEQETVFSIIYRTGKRVMYLEFGE